MIGRSWRDVEAKYAAYRAAWIENMDAEEFKWLYLNEWTVPSDHERIIYDHTGV